MQGGFSGWRRWLPSSLVLLPLVVLASACGSQQLDARDQLLLEEVTTGWFDAGIVDGKNKLVPTISLQLKNAGPDTVDTVQLNAVFRRVGEEEEWGSAFVRAVGADGLGAGSSTPPLVMRSQLGYTGEQPRNQMLQHREFMDARVELFAKRGSEQWAKLGEFPIKRQLLTQ
jgi:hypothetical protein